MPYTDAWLDAAFPGSSAASTIDDEIRKLRLQIDERMTGSLVVDWKSDPIVPLIGGTPGPRTIIIPSHAFVSNGDSSSPIYELGYITSSSGVKAGISNIIPAGSTITLLEWVINNGTAATLNCQLEHYAFSVTPAPAVVDSLITNAIAGIKLLTTAPLTVLVDAAKYYGLNVFSAVPAVIFVYACRVTYTLP